MAVLSHTVIPQLDQETYDGMFQQAGGTLRAAPCFIAHFAGPAEDSWAVTEIWESREAVEAFIRDVVAPATEQASAPLPQIQIRPLHNVVVPSQE
jgi:hypothetical protein